MKKYCTLCGREKRHELPDEFCIACRRNCRMCRKRKSELADGAEYCFDCLPKIEINPRALRAYEKAQIISAKRNEKLRNCRTCGKPNLNYFNCDDCRSPKLNDFDIDMDSPPDYLPRLGNGKVVGGT